MASSNFSNAQRMSYLESSDLATANVEISYLQQELKASKEEANELQQLVNILGPDLKRAVERLRAEQEACKDHHISKAEHAAMVESALDSAKATIGDLEHEIDELNNHASSEADHIANMESDSIAATATIAALEHKVKSTLKEKDRAQSDKNAAQAALADYEQTISTLRDELTQSKLELRSKAKHAASVESTLDAANAKISTLRKTAGSLETSLLTLQKEHVAVKDMYEANLAEERENCTVQDEEISGLRGSVKEAEARTQSVRNDLFTVRADAKKEKEALKAELQREKEVNEVLARRIRELSTQVLDVSHH